MSRKWIGLIAGVLVLFGAAYVGSPYWAARQFRNAALGGDVDRLEDAVDFPAVRDSLKGQLTVALTEKMNNDPALKGNPFAGIGMMMMPAMISSTVDGFVTPHGIAAMMRRGKVERAKNSTEISPDISYDYDYRGLDRFAVTVRRPDDDVAQAPSFVFERRGIFSWKMIRMQIPTDFLKAT